MDMPAYQTHHQKNFIPTSFGDCHVDFHRQVREKSNCVKFQQKMNKRKRKRKNVSEKDKYNENMSPAKVDVPNTDENMPPTTVDVKF